MVDKKKRIGILGGTFNPIHLGHLMIAEMALEAFCLNRVIFVPAKNLKSMHSFFFHNK